MAVEEKAISEQTISDPLLTCAACSRVMHAVDDDGTLPVHVRPVIFIGNEEDTMRIQCPGSRTKGYSYRPLPEIKPLYIEFVDEDGNGEDKHVRVIAAAAAYLHHWTNDYGMPRDTDSLIRLSAHANNAEHAALRLMSPRATLAAEARRHRSAGFPNKAL